MIVLKHFHDRHPIRNYAMRLAGKIAICGFVVAMLILAVQ
jgi:hypothetical protein